MADFNAPNLTPEDLAAIQAAQAQAAQSQQGAQPAPEENAAQPQPAAQLQPAAQPAPEAAPTSPEDIELAKKMLGLDKIEQQALEAQQKLRELEVERTQAVIKAKYPDLPIDLVQKEIEKVKQANPKLAEAMETNPDLMEMAAKSALMSIKPTEKPDTITQGQGDGQRNPQDELVDKIKKGDATNFDLGDYILSSSQQ